VPITVQLATVRSFASIRFVICEVGASARQRHTETGVSGDKTLTFRGREDAFRFRPGENGYPKQGIGGNTLTEDQAGHGFGIILYPNRRSLGQFEPKHAAYSGLGVNADFSA
jgi:hypothetical protein